MYGVACSRVYILRHIKCQFLPFNKIIIIFCATSLKINKLLPRFWRFFFDGGIKIVHAIIMEGKNVLNTEPLWYQFILLTLYNFLFPSSRGEKNQLTNTINDPSKNAKYFFITSKINRQHTHTCYYDGREQKAQSREYDELSVCRMRFFL